MMHYGNGDKLNYVNIQQYIQFTIFHIQWETCCEPWQQ